MNVIQNTRYFITENGNDICVKVKSVGGKVLRRRTDGHPYLCCGGEVMMRYANGTTRRITSKQFQTLNPRLAWLVPLEG